MVRDTDSRFTLVGGFVFVSLVLRAYTHTYVQAVRTAYLAQ